MVKKVKVGDIFYWRILNLYYKIFKVRKGLVLYSVKRPGRSEWTSVYGSNRPVDFFIKECIKIPKLKSILLFE